MIYFVTGNAGKLREVRAMLPGVQIEQLDIDLPEIQEIDSRKVIEAKIAEAKKHCRGELIVEDTSLYMDALSGKLPGPLVKWFLVGIGRDGLANVASKSGIHGATATTLLAYVDATGNTRLFEGSIKGSIVYSRGESNFGWDPVFQPDGLIKTFAQLSLEEKNRISHRKKAFDKLRQYLNGHK